MKKKLLCFLPVFLCLVFQFSNLGFVHTQTTSTLSNEPKGNIVNVDNSVMFEVQTDAKNDVEKKMSSAIEDVSKRDKWSYHYKLSNGHYGAQIYAAPVNYLKDGRWVPIIPVLKNSTKEGYAFECSEMNGKVLIPQASSGKTQIEFDTKKVSFLSKGLKIVSSNGETNCYNQKQVKLAQKISNSEVHFDNVYEGLTEYIGIGNDAFSMHLILNSLGSFIQNASNDSYLEYDIVVNFPGNCMPLGYQDEFLTKNGITFYNQNQEFVFRITPPVMYDANHSKDYEYKWKSISNGEGILTLRVPISWLKSSERVFPITIDPSVEIYATGSGYVEVSGGILGANYTINQNNNMKTGGTISAGMLPATNYDKLRGYAQFNISSIPTGNYVFNHSLRLSSCYTNTGQFWVAYGPAGNEPATTTGTLLYREGHDMVAYKTWTNTAIGTTEWHDMFVYNTVITHRVTTSSNWYAVKTASAESNGSWPRLNDAEVDFCAHNVGNIDNKPMLFVEYDLLPEINSVECNLTATASDYLINPGESVTIAANGTLNNIPLNNDFNGGSVGTGWDATTAATFSNPSCAAPSLDGTTFLWMGDASPHPRRLVSQAFDVHNGGWISFDLKFSMQGVDAPCEGPDEPQEGVALEYSLDNGNTWASFAYFHPMGYITVVNPGSDGEYVNSNTATAFTSWANYVFPIPPIAYSNSTKFRWNQDGSSGALYDNWGLDNIIITTPIDANIYWVHDPAGGDTLTVSPSQTTTYTAWITNGIDSCFAEVTIELDVLACQTPTPEISNLPEICVSSSRNVSLVNQNVYSPAATYQWTFQGGTPSTATGPGPHNVVWNTPGSFVVSVVIVDKMNLSGTLTTCSPSSDSTTITVNPNPTISFSATPTSGCTPLTSVFTAQSSPPAQSYSWNLGVGFTSTNANPSFTFVMPGQYNASLTITDTNGCTATSSVPIYISVYPIPNVDFTVEPEIGFIEIPINFTSSYTTSPATWTWDFGDGSNASVTAPATTHTYTQSGIFSVTHTVQSQYGCTNSITHDYTVIVDIIIPNVYTPNDDGVNDFFVIDGIDLLKNCELKIYNRWGRKVYESDSYKNDWDGKGFAEGTYYYVFTTPIKTLKPFHGTVTLLR